MDNKWMTTVERVAAIFGTTKDLVLSKSRKRDAVEARFTLFYLLKNSEPFLPLTYIGWKTGNRDHASVLHGLRKFDQYFSLDKGFRDKASKAMDFVGQNGIM